MTQRRWLRPRSGGQTIDKRSPLQIAVVDFERYVTRVPSERNELNFEQVRLAAGDQKPRFSRSILDRLSVEILFSLYQFSPY